jgi:allantoicase
MRSVCLLQVIVKDPGTGLVHMPGAQDWCVLRLAAVAGGVEKVEIDTAHFRGNYPESGSRPGDRYNAGAEHC